MIIQLGQGLLNIGSRFLPGLLNRLPSTIVRPQGRKVVGSQSVPGPNVNYNVGSVPKPPLPTLTRGDKLAATIAGGGLLYDGIINSPSSKFYDNANVANAMPPERPIVPNVDNTEITPRFEQVLFPGISGQATNKELINAAILRGSLELLKPKQAGENFASQASRALEAGLDVNKTTTGVYSTAQAALQAAKAAGFKNIKVYAKGNGFGYTGEVGGFDDYLGGKTESGEGDSSEGTGLQVLSKEEYNKAVQLILNDFPNATDQQIIDTLNNQGFTYEG